MRLVAEVVDKTTGPLSKIRKAFQDTNQEVQVGHEKSGKAAREHAKHLKELHERFAKVREVSVELVTPALAAVGIAGLSAAEAIKSVVEASKRFGETGRILEMVHNRSGMTVGKIRELDEVAEQAGISVEAMNQGLSNMGEFLDQTSKGMPEALNKWNSMPLAFQKIGKAMVGVSRDQAAQMAIDFLPKMTDKAQRRQFLALLGLPEDFASFSNELLKEIFADAKQWNERHPFDAKRAEEAERAWRKLGSTLRGVKSDIEATFAAPAFLAAMDKIKEFFDDPHVGKWISDEVTADLRAVKDTIEEMKWIIEKIEEFNEWRQHGSEAPGGTFGQGKAPAPGKSDFMPRGLFSGPKGAAPGKTGHRYEAPDPLFVPTSFSSGSSDAEKMLRLGVKEGVLDAFREWMAEKNMPGAAGGGGGFTNANFNPSGSAPNKFGNKDFPLLENGEVPKSVQGTRERVTTGSRGEDVPAGSGPKSGLTRNKREVAKVIADEWRRAGMSEEGIAGLMANVQDESGFNNNLRHPDQPHYGGEAHFAHGLYQEGGAEWNRYASWLQKNHPGADWRDPRLQSRFAAENLKKNYPGTWQRMLKGNRFQAGAAYVDGYLKPAAAYRYGRMRKYLGGGVAPLGHYTGPEDHELSSTDRINRGFEDPGDKGIHIRPIDGSLLKNYRGSGLNGPSATKVTGDASLRIDLNGFPKGTRTASAASGLFKEVQLNRGRAMPMSSQDA